MLPITNQETLEIAFLDNSLELYIEVRVENLPHQNVHISFSGFFPSNSKYNYNKAERLMWGQISMRQAQPLHGIVGEVRLNSHSKHPNSQRCLSEGFR